VLTYEPDRAGNFYSLTPRVMINLDDLAATGVVQPGSRVSYRELWRGNARALETYRQLIKPGLAANQRMQDARDGNRQIGGALGKAERYLNMASLVAVCWPAWPWHCRPTASPPAASMPAPAALPGPVAARNHGAVQPATDRTRIAREPQRRRARLAGATGPVCLAA
jgi:hypothetical protein